MRIVTALLAGVLSVSGCEVFNLPASKYAAAPECGAAQTESPPAELVRWPVLQSVSATEATVTWGVQGDAAGQLRFGPEYTASAAAVELGTTMLDGRPLRLLAAHAAGLAPATRYCYEVLAGSQVLAAGLVLQSAPAVTTAAIRFHVIGDYGSGAWAQRRVRTQMEKLPADLVITTGDNAYPQGTFEQFEHNVFAVYRTLFARVPVFPSPGNHDYKTDGARPYLTEFVLPENAWRAADRERYYSFDWGPVHFVALDSERPLEEISPAAADDMADWLDADLARSKRPWTIVYFHRPPYTASDHHPGNQEVIARLVPIFTARHVALVLTGHNHLYERFEPKNGVTYVTTGGGGAHAYPAGTAPGLVATSDDYHFVTARADECRIEARAVNASGDEIDRFTLSRCAQ